MGIQLLEHATDGILHKLGLIDGIDIEIAHGHLCNGELTEMFVSGFLSVSRDGGKEQQECCYRVFLIHKHLLRVCLLR